MSKFHVYVDANIWLSLYHYSNNSLALGVCQIFCVNPFLVVETFGRFVGSKHLAGR